MFLFAPNACSGCLVCLFFSCSTAPVYGLYPGSQGCAFIFNFSIQAAREETARLDVTVGYLQEELANRRFVACFCRHNQDQSILFLLWHSFIQFQKIRYRYYLKHYVVKLKNFSFRNEYFSTFSSIFMKRILKVIESPASRIFSEWLSLLIWPKPTSCVS